MYSHVSHTSHILPFFILFFWCTFSDNCKLSMGRSAGPNWLWILCNDATLYRRQHVQTVAITNEMQLSKGIYYSTVH